MATRILTKDKIKLFETSLKLLEPIPSDQWIEGEFTDQIGKCCAIGHLTRLQSGRPKDYSMHNCSDTSFTDSLRYASESFVSELNTWGREKNIAHVNNGETMYNWGNNPKERVISFLKHILKSQET